MGNDGTWKSTANKKVDVTFKDINGKENTYSLEFNLDTYEAVVTKPESAI